MKTKTEATLSVLERAYALLKKKNGWAQGVMMRDADGNECADDEATCYCAVGALRKASGFPYKGIRNYRYAVRALEQNVPASDKVNYEDDPEGAVIAYNDHIDRTRRQILSLFRRTIRKLAA